MERELIHIILPQSGVTVSIQPFLTYGEQRRIKEIAAGEQKQTNVNGQLNIEFSGNTDVKLYNEIVKIFVKKIVTGSGEELECTREVLFDNITEADGMELEAAIMSRIEFLKKK